VVDTFAQTGRSTVGLMTTPVDEVHHFGCVTGTWRKADRTLDITEFAEKPTAEYAREHLPVEGLDTDQFLSVFGIYVLRPQIFELLDAQIRDNVRERGEFQLTSCLDQLRRADGFVGQVIEGRRYDIGNPQAYVETIATFAHTPTVSTRG
jgi:UTP--glucose-1-phosphate uridylyltransferase